VTLMPPSASCVCVAFSLPRTKLASLCSLVLSERDQITPTLLEELVSTAQLAVRTVTALTESV
jgi:hypothetical protein